MNEDSYLDASYEDRYDDPWWADYEEDYDPSEEGDLDDDGDDPDDDFPLYLEYPNENLEELESPF